MRIRDCSMPYQKRDRWTVLAAGLCLSAVAAVVAPVLFGGDQATPGSASERIGSVEIVAVADDKAPAPRKISFNRDIRPILTENCYACHGPDLNHAAADLSLHTFERATAELFDGIAAFKPGDLESSEAWTRINDRATPMPPKKSHKVLTDEQKELIRLWIEQGAKYQPHWAYVAPTKVPPPVIEGKHADWPEHWIDRFILSNLQEQGLEPVADADRVTLIRRLSLDLTGLPPTPDEVDAFVSDKSPDAYEKVVDRLLASPHFGERMAMYWLDVVRFADSVGYHGDQTMSITPYRDWVIWAFNENLPYTTFVKHQVAGDLVEGANDNTLIASAYNRLYQTSHEGGIQRKEYEAIYDADRVRNFSEAFMGATIGCAQCHDHKYDPYTDEDFYALAAFFGQVDDLWHLPSLAGGNGPGTNSNPTKREPTVDVLSPLDKQRKAALEANLAEAIDAELKKTIKAEINAIKPRRVMISKQAEKPRAVRLLSRGNWLDETGPVMKPAIPEFMGKLDVQGTPTRLDLANWLVTPEAKGGSGELTARVLVNRLWYLLYGEGLTTSLGDFGGQGVPPNHPDLLDQLAIEMVDNDWDIKAMMKTMVMTRTYRLSSKPTKLLLERDPENVMFARQSQHRLQAEMIRDQALLVGGLLVDQLGGESARPYQPEGYYQHLNFPKRKYATHTDLNQWRRGVYVHWQRQFLHPMLKAFDAPSREECTAKRPISNTPLAALVLMNDPTFVEAARGFAQRVLTQAKGNDREKLNWAMRTVLSREASDQEAAVLLAVLNANRKVFAAEPERATALLSVGLSQRDQSLDKVEHAAWAEVCRTLLNLHETITRP